MTARRDEDAVEPVTSADALVWLHGVTVGLASGNAICSHHYALSLPVFAFASVTCFQVRHRHNINLVADSGRRLFVDHPPTVEYIHVSFYVHKTVVDPGLS